MPTYLYFCEIHKEFEIVHKITEIIKECPKCKEEGLQPKILKRLIIGGSGFVLAGSGWAKDSYSK